MKILYRAAVADSSAGAGYNEDRANDYFYQTVSFYFFR